MWTFKKTPVYALVKPECLGLSFAFVFFVCFLFSKSINTLKNTVDVILEF